MLSQLLHSGFIAKDRALGALATGVDGKHSQLAAFLLQHVHSKLIYRGTLTSSRHTTDTNADGVAAIRQTLVDNFLRLGLMVGVYTLDKCYGLRQYGYIALDDTLNHFVY